MATWGLETEIVDLRDLPWDNLARAGGSVGMLDKCVVEHDGTPWFYKTSSFCPARDQYGVESINELIASRVMDLLEIDHVSYELLHALVEHDGTTYETWVARSPSYLGPQETSISLEEDYQFAVHHKGYKGDPLKYVLDSGWEQSLYQYLAVDYLIANRDRHGANIEVVRRNDGTKELAPIYDCGLSFCAPLFFDPDAVEQFVPLRDVRCNNYLGTPSLEENLALINPTVLRRDLTDNDIEAVLQDLDDVLPAEHLAKTREILTERWLTLEIVRDSYAQRQPYEDRDTVLRRDTSGLVNRPRH